jgi:hypothetical protein
MCLTLHYLLMKVAPVTTRAHMTEISAAHDTGSHLHEGWAKPGQAPTNLLCLKARKQPHDAVRPQSARPIYDQEWYGVYLYMIPFALRKYVTAHIPAQVHIPDSS